MTHCCAIHIAVIHQTWFAHIDDLEEALHDLDVLHFGLDMHFGFLAASMFLDSENVDFAHTKAVDA